MDSAVQEESIHFQNHHLLTLSDIRFMKSLIRRVNTALSWVMKHVKGTFFNTFKPPAHMRWARSKHCYSHDGNLFQ